jgi:hypothetical protein
LQQFLQHDTGIKQLYRKGALPNHKVIQIQSEPCIVELGR